MENFTEYTFRSMDELKSFIEERKGDKEAHFYWGFIENFDGEMYTIEDLERDASEDWFASVDGEDAVSTVFEFEC